jgi:phosphoglycerate kinase
MMRLLYKADNILIGGSLSYCFLKAKGHNIGSTPYDDEDVIIAKQLLLEDIDNKIILRVDHTVTGLSPLYSYQTPSEKIPNGLIAYDIGDKTLKLFSKYLRNAKVVFWNGPMGMYEDEKFRRGSMELIKTIIHSKKCESLVIGGGETSHMFRKCNNYNNNTHILTGGGASLEYLSKRF